MKIVNKTTTTNTVQTMKIVDKTTTTSKVQTMKRNNKKDYRYA